MHERLQPVLHLGGDQPAADARPLVTLHLPIEAEAFSRLLRVATEAYPDLTVSGEGETTVLSVPDDREARR